MHMKSSKVSIETRSTPASLSFKGQATKHTTVKRSIEQKLPGYHTFKTCFIEHTKKQKMKQKKRSEA